MKKLYRLSSIIFRAIYCIGAVVILFFNYALSGFNEVNDNSLILPFLFCMLCVFIITLFHKVSLKSFWSKILRILSFFIILISLIGSFYLSNVILKNDGSILALITLIMLALVSIILIYFVLRNNKYSYNYY
jgi:lysylphosphatidylglycerol synthetase-like protein (DUF2156 family)